MDQRDIVQVRPDQKMFQAGIRPLLMDGDEHMPQIVEPPEE